MALFQIFRDWDDDDGDGEVDRQLRETIAQQAELITSLKRQLKEKEKQLKDKETTIRGYKRIKFTD